MCHNPLDFSGIGICWLSPPGFWVRLSLTLFPVSPHCWLFLDGWHSPPLEESKLTDLGLGRKSHSAPQGHPFPILLNFVAFSYINKYQIVFVPFVSASLHWFSLERFVNYIEPFLVAFFSISTHILQSHFKHEDFCLARRMTDAIPAEQSPPWPSSPHFEQQIDSSLY